MNPNGAVLNMKVLFVGNSHTYFHYVPARVSYFCAQQGKPIEAVMLTHPGMGLDWHLKQEMTYYNLTCGDYDAVVFQHVAHPFPGKDALLEAGTAIAAVTPEKAKKYLYMTWSEQKNPEGQAIMTESYEALAEKIGAVICPVGSNWWEAQKLYLDAHFYHTDGEHSSVLGASFSAAVIGRTLLGMEVDPAICYADAKVMAELPEDPAVMLGKRAES